MARRFSEPHRVSEPVKTRQLRLKTDDQVTHAAWPNYRFDGDTRDVNNAITLCGRRVHHCDLRRCEHGDRHAGHVPCARMPHGNDVDCITCLVREARRR